MQVPLYLHAHLKGQLTLGVAAEVPSATAVQVATAMAVPHHEPCTLVCIFASSKPIRLAHACPMFLVRCDNTTI